MYQKSIALMLSVGLAIATPIISFAQEKLLIQTVRGDIEVIKNPQRVAVFDWAALDTLMKLGVSVGATTTKMHVDYLAPAFEHSTKVGHIFQPDYEKLHAYQADLIITGGPGAEAYPHLIKIAPTIDITVDDKNIRSSGKQQIEILGKIFSKEQEAKALQEKIDRLFTETRQLAQGKGNALVVSITGNRIAAFGANARLSSWIHEDIGMPPVDPTLSNKGHGEPISFEYIRKKNPDWIFVLDRTASLGEEAPSAITLLDNSLVRGTKAWQNKRVILMPTANYIAAGGTQQLINAVTQLREELNKD